jgi:glycerol-3-phosphate O-acyltransferase
MHIEIHDHTKLREIQEVFSDFYPYLRIEFFREPHEKYESSAENALINPERTVADVKKTHISGLLEILPLNKVSEVEREFTERFGLSVQILRKQNDHWEQSTGADDFTLKELNEIARNSSDEFVVSDYEEGWEQDEGFDKPVIES